MGFLNSLFVSCREATFLHTKQQEGKLTFGEAAGLKVHLLYCSLCRLFFKQLDTIEECAHAYSHSENTGATLDETAKGKMAEKIAQELKK